MNKILYEIRCKCREELSVVTKHNPKKRSEGKPIQYPSYNDSASKTFQIKCKKKLAPITKTLLNSFQKKYLYYAIDDILYLLKSYPAEQNNILNIIYSPIISLQNNFSISFLDIWIHELYINEFSKKNKFLGNKFKSIEEYTYITIKFVYKKRFPLKKQKSLW